MLGPRGEKRDNGRGPTRVKYALKGDERGYREWLNAQLCTGISVEVNLSLKEGQSCTLRGVCKGRENRGLATVGETPDSVRGLTRVQYPTRVIGKQYGGGLRACTGTGRTV